MRSLFWKIFLWFWGAILLIGAALYGVVLTTPPDPMPRPWRETATRLLASYARESVAVLEQSGTGALHEYFDELDRDTQGHFWLFDSRGREVSGRPIPPRIPNSQLLPPPQRDPRNIGQKRIPVENKMLLRTLCTVAVEEHRTVFKIYNPRILAAVPITSNSKKSYVMIASLARPAFARTIAEPRRQLLGLVALAIVSTLVCLALVRSLTSPIFALRKATQQLAMGELSTRVAPDIKKRKDEISDLAADFDGMASRIEVLVDSQRRLLGDVSHELRSPLARLSMALGLARRHAQSGAMQELEADLDRIAREKERMNELIGGLLELARLEGGKTSAHSERINLKTLIEEIVADADYEAQQLERRVLITRADGCFVAGSGELLRRALENVVRNAVHYTPPATSVAISLAAQGEYSVIRVRDHGSGVPQDALEKLFEPFYRVEQARDRDSGGVGLGLAITARAVASHGGRVLARNAEGGGLEIEISLPHAAAPKLG